MSTIVIQHGLFDVEKLVDSWLQQENNGEQFPVEFDVAWQVAGYSEKGKGKRRLTSKSSHLIEGEDYVTQSGKWSSGGRSSDFIKMTCDAFKQFCLMAETDQGREIHHYFIECEKKWKITQQHFPDVAQTVEDIRLNKMLELERLKIRNKELDDSMLKIHGKETVLLLRGYDDHVVTIEKTVTEVVNPVTERCDRILTADQLKEAVKKSKNQKISSLTWFVNKLKEKGRDDLVVAVTRNVTNQYVLADRLDEAIYVVYGQQRQMLIGE